jgi:hypothetical protein
MKLFTSVNEASATWQSGGWESCAFTVTFCNQGNVGCIFPDLRNGPYAQNQQRLRHKSLGGKPDGLPLGLILSSGAVISRLLIL